MYVHRAHGDEEADAPCFAEDGFECLPKQRVMHAWGNGGGEAGEEGIHAGASLMGAPFCKPSLLRQLHDSVGFCLGESAADGGGGGGFILAVEVVDLGVVFLEEALDDLDVEAVAFDPREDDAGEEEVASSAVGDEGSDVLW